MNDRRSWEAGRDAADDAVEAVDTEHREDVGRYADEALQAIRALTPPSGPPTVVLSVEEAQAIMHDLGTEGRAEMLRARIEEAIRG